MKRWSAEAEQKILKLTHTDLDYQEILRKVQEKGPDYRRILSTLSDVDALSVDDYVALCEELLYQKVRISYLAGSDYDPHHEY